MSTWTISVIIPLSIIIVIIRGKTTTIENRISKSSYPEFILQTVEKCNSMNKYPWFMSSSDEKMCKSLLYSNEYVGGGTDDDSNNKINNYQPEDLEFGDIDQQQQRINYQQQRQISKMYTNEKRGFTGSGMGCDCQIKNDVKDLGYLHFPRYVFNAICQENNIVGNNGGVGETGTSGSEMIMGINKRSHGRKCWRGSQCKPIEYQIQVLTRRTPDDLNSVNNHHSSVVLPDDLKPEWKFKTYTVAAGCYCSF